MRGLDQILTQAVAREDLPFAVAMVADSAGVLWEGAAGQANPQHAAGPDTVFALMSMTKAVASVAALILVDRGLMSLDVAVTSVVPEFARIKVLESIGPDGPVLRPPRRPVTLRHLLTHTSGFAYNTYHREQDAYEKLTGAQGIGASTFEALMYPLMFDPGDDFAYGISTNWVGVMVERIGGRPIDRFCQEEIFDVVGMRDTMFEADGVKERLAEVKFRRADGTLEDYEYRPRAHPELYCMGGALYGTAPDYIRFLRVILNGGQVDGQRLISPTALQLMLDSQICDLSVPVLKSGLDVSCDVDLFPGTRMTWTAAFLRNEEDIPGMRSAGSLTWAGFLNSHYWINPVKDIAAVMMTQSLPFCEPRYMQVYEDFERAVYRQLAR